MDGNRITSLTNGDAFFPAMLDAIGSVQHSVTFETYIYWQSDMGRQFADALIDRARAGVKLQVMLDWQGSISMDAQFLQSLKDAEVESDRYHPLWWYNIRRVSNRTHRKILVVDNLWTSVGSINFDNRSFRLNDEANLNVYDADFAVEQADVFERDKEQSRRVTLEEWRNRPWSGKLKEWLAGVVRSQL